MFTARLTVSQGTGLNLFSSKEAEYEQRAAHLKKINFIIYASEREQYSRSVSEILGSPFFEFTQVREKEVSIAIKYTLNIIF